MKNSRRLIIILIALGLFTSNIIVGAFIPRVVALSNWTTYYYHNLTPGTYFTVKSSKYPSQNTIAIGCDEIITKTSSSIIISKIIDKRYKEEKKPVVFSNYKFYKALLEIANRNVAILTYYGKKARNTLVRVYRSRSNIEKPDIEWYIPGEPVFLTGNLLNYSSSREIALLVTKTSNIYKLYQLDIYNHNFTLIAQSPNPIIGAGFIDYLDGTTINGVIYATPHSISLAKNSETATLVNLSTLSNFNIEKITSFHISNILSNPTYYSYKPHITIVGRTNSNNNTILTLKVKYDYSNNKWNGRIVEIGYPHGIDNIKDAIKTGKNTYAIYDGHRVYTWYTDIDAIEYLFSINNQSGFTDSHLIDDDNIYIVASQIGPYAIPVMTEYQFTIKVRTDNLTSRLVNKNEPVSFREYIYNTSGLSGSNHKLSYEITSGASFININLSNSKVSANAEININGKKANIPEIGYPLSYKYKAYFTSELEDRNYHTYINLSNIYAEYYSYLFMFDPGKVTKYPEVIMEYENKTTNNFVLGNSIGTVKISNTGETPETIKCFSTRKYVKFDTSTITISPGETKEIQILPAFDIKDYNVLYRDTITCQWRLGILKQDIVYTLGKIEYKINPSDIKVSASNESVETYKDWINNEISLNIPYPSNAKETKIVIEPQNTFYGTITAGDKTYKINGNDIITIPVPPGGITITVNLENNPENKHPYLDIYQKYMGESILLGELDLGYAHYINDSAQIDINSYYIHPNYLTAYISQGGVYDLLTQIEYYYYNNNFINLRNNILSLFASNKESFSINIYDPNSNKEKELIEYNNKKLIYPIISIEKEGKKYMSLTDLQNQLSDIGITITFESATRINISGAILEHGQYNWRPASY